MVPLPVRIVFSFGIGVWVLTNIKLPPLEILVGIDLLPIIMQEVFIGLSCGMVLSICFGALVGKSFLPLLDNKNPSVFGFLSARVGSISDNNLGGWHAYRASKASLNMLIKNFAIELARTNKFAKVIGLHPGTVDTELSKPFQKNVPENKLFTPQFSADAMINVVDRLKEGDSGSVFAFDGSKIES